jgi:hypothetical protein
VLNTGDVKVDIPLNLVNFLPNDALLLDPWSEDQYQVENGLLTVSIDSLQAKVMVYQP